VYVSVGKRHGHNKVKEVQDLNENILKPRPAKYKFGVTHLLCMFFMEDRERVGHQNVENLNVQYVEPTSLHLACIDILKER
jgi:hypothetical protein